MALKRLIVAIAMAGALAAPCHAQEYMGGGNSGYMGDTPPATVQQLPSGGGYMGDPAPYAVQRAPGGGYSLRPLTPQPPAGLSDLHNFGSGGDSDNSGNSDNSDD
jgi:hypothetical protein